MYYLIRLNINLRAELDFDGMITDTRKNRRDEVKQEVPFACYYFFVLVTGFVSAHICE